AIGVPGKHVGGVRSGEVIVRLAAVPARGLVLTPGQVPGGDGLEGARFGDALAAANLLPGTGVTDDLVVGSPEGFTSPRRSGAAYVFLGRTDHSFTGLQLLRPSDTGAMRFGAALAIGDFDATGLPQLAIGAPDRSITATLQGISYSVANAGAIYWFKPGSGRALSYAQAVRLDERPAGTNHHFGGALAASPNVFVDYLAAGLPDVGAGKLER